ncbi:hypothetical protein INS49_007743 [Diaporthe citri]|uniref:uncharacterized protein n=1 Tax=Diaporthe citri TaxID=83186 RepID=UPI001C815D06|nr:uncharacterized protein INS49_007743 [Diaporthe citri]KAG6362651.1 hypothetical protein INS49_007743 [Diaporthe citri]
MHFLLLALAAVMASVSAITVKLPLYSRATEPTVQGSTRFRLPVSARQSDIDGVNVPVTDWFSRSDNQWYTTFSIGTPPEELTASFDTGSSRFILPRVNCTTGTCANLTLFDPDKSSTFSPLPGTDEQSTFATGSDSVPLPRPEVVTCRSVHDTVSLAWGQLKVENQGFALCDTYTGAMGESKISGIMGMGIYDPSANDTPWYWNLVEDGQLESHLFSFYIPPAELVGKLDGGQVTLGGMDMSKVDGDIHWTNLSVDATPDVYTYVLDQSAIYADGKILDPSVPNANLPNATAFGYAFLDTGTAFMQTPDFDTAKAIYAQISPNITQIDPAGAWGAPCGQLDSIAPDLTFTLGNQTEALNLTIPKKYFNLGEYPGLPGICQAVFNNPTDGSETSLDDAPLWIAGSPLLDKYYTVWDGVDLRIGWGKLSGLPGFNGSDST